MKLIVKCVAVTEQLAGEEVFSNAQLQVIGNNPEFFYKGNNSGSLNISNLIGKPYEVGKEYTLSL